MGNNIIIEESGKGGIILYQTPDGQTSLEVKLENETVWLTQAQICTLFDKSKGTISEHISNVFKEGELAKDSVVREFRTTAADGKTYITKYYSLDVIISVGYRVKSKRGTQFRIWANSVLKDYLIKGYAVKNSLIQELHRTDLPDLGRAGPLSVYRRKSRCASIPGYKEPFLHRRQQENSRYSFLVVHGEQRYLVCSGWKQENS